MTTTTAPEQDVEKNKSLAADLPDDTLVDWLRDMLLIREFEVRTMQAYQNKKIGGFCHVYIGQEAVAVGCVAAVKKGDPIITAYRDHGHALAVGMDPKHCMAEMYGKIDGCAKGKGGSMHMFDKSNNLFGGHGIVGAHTPVGAGLAFANKYIDEVINGGTSSKVTLCFLGDGALNQGAFHEALNLAGLFDVPVIYIVENNGYSMGTAISRGTTLAHDIAGKADAYEIDGHTIKDGMDVMAIYDAMKPIVDKSRENSRPALVDLQTYRYKGHSMSDPRKYRTKDEEQQWEERDPIERLRSYLQDNRDFSEDDFKKMNKEIKKIVRGSMEFAEQSPEPDLDELYHDVYVEKMGRYTGSSLPSMLDDEQNNA